MTDHVTETLRMWRAVPFSYATGQDCLMSQADYVERVTGADYGATWRGQYSDRDGALMLVRQAGGAFAMMDSSGLPRTDRPQRGDIVLAGFNHMEIGGICTGPGFAFRTENGVYELGAKFVNIIGAWAVK